MRALRTACALASLAIASPTARAAAPDFGKEIRPVLETRCVGCHGPAKQRGLFRLDTRQGLLDVGEDGPRIVPGQAKASRLIELVSASDPDDRMPPGAERAALAPQEIAALARWIDAGAPWPAGVVLTPPEGEAQGHWAFTAPQRPPAPRVRTAGWARNPIDAFVLARLEAKGRVPAPEADRTTWLRRVTLDLTGLPPTLAEVDAFVADRAPRAHERAIDRLLASPRFGERWARVWLDVARYADSDGFEKDKRRSIWPYRDWVIDALNRDLPYDRFVVEQIAGDLLPNATASQRVATGFLRNSMINEEGGADPEQFRVEALFDRVDAIGKSVLGLTVQCAQCHTHKFDPITQEDYYRMVAFLNGDDEASMPVYADAEARRRADVLTEIARLEDGLRRAHPEWRAQLAAWEREDARRARPRWTTLQAPFIDDSTGGQKYVAQPDGSFLAQGYAPTKHDARVVVKTALPRVGAFRLEQLPDPNLPLGGPGRAIRGTSALTAFVVEATPIGHPEGKRKLTFARATADFEQPERPLDALFDDKSGRRRVTGPAAFAIDDKEETAWGIDAGPGRRNVARQAVFALAAPIENAAGWELAITLSQRHGGWNSDDVQTHNLGRFRISVTDAADAVADPVPPTVRAILAVPANARTAAQEAALFSYVRTTVRAWADANARIEAAWARHPEGTPTLVLQRRPTPRETHVLERGDFLKRGKLVQPAPPRALHPLPEGAPPNRLGLARWLVDRRSPTTARVIVNRIWQAYFGVGLVATPEDLGTQGEAPSHPELLDWLAVELMDHGWSLKHLHRLITSSATYRQASAWTPEAKDDPQNRLLARGPRVRVDAELVRDGALAASGLLVTSMRGPSVMPPAPAFLFAPPNSYAPFPWVDADGGDRYRRSIYVFHRRATPFPALHLFDAPKADVACPRRARSNTPLQALVTLNEPTMMAAARALARVMLTSGASDDARVAHGFRRVLARAPRPDELRELTGLLARQRARVRDGWSDAWLVAGGTTDPPRDVPAGETPADVAAYTVVARVLLNLDEAITKE